MSSRYSTARIAKLHTASKDPLQPGSPCCYELMGSWAPPYFWWGWSHSPTWSSLEKGCWLPYLRSFPLLFLLHLLSAPQTVGPSLSGGRNVSFKPFGRALLGRKPQVHLQSTGSSCPFWGLSLVIHLLATILPVRHHPSPPTFSFWPGLQENNQQWLWRQLQGQ